MNYFEDTGHWEYDEHIPVDTYGFIYKITNNLTGKMYIGKKQVVKIVKRKPLKGKKNKRLFRTESDWRTYTGSCNQLNEDIENIGKDSFKFEVLLLCDSKWSLSYEEARLQFKSDVLISESYYNGIINCRIGKKRK